VNQQQLKHLFEKYVAGTCSGDELETLFQYIRDDRNEFQLRELLREYQVGDEYLGKDFEENMMASFRKTDEYLAEELVEQKLPYRPQISKMRWLAYAAATLIILGFSYLTWQKWTELSSLDSKHYAAVPTAPLSLGQLKLPSGEVVALNQDVKTAKVIFQSNQVELVQQVGNLLEIKGAGDEKALTTSLKLTVAKGKRLQVRFADGSSVMLNSTSQLQFPLAFETKERHTELSGEGYFEIAHNPQRPFYVNTTTQLIQVFGTKFNVREYPNEDLVSTALFEGKVSVTKRAGKDLGQADFLSPGKRIVISRQAQTSTKENIANENVIKGWTSGRRYYNGVALKTILNDLTHDFDIQVDWANVPNLRFQGTIPQDYPLDEILKLISQTADIKIQRKENRITFQ